MNNTNSDRPVPPSDTGATLAPDPTALPSAQSIDPFHRPYGKQLQQGDRSGFRTAQSWLWSHQDPSRGGILLC
ncbi:hypothetical protein [Leptolyngbya sp. FACHB-8]|uniref:hypothetical protein n=1 Tax=unclassified Leptolyngbya TaxID=2650499 RepID=UPI001683F5C6|nr:hypothetical protein [Leptolyngbya sp. FACHB-8]MBD1911277.1 hypothetical protein [Leptolyngbya sp. FACHB-8]